MGKELVNKKVGGEGIVTLGYEGGKFRLEVGYDGKQADAGVFIDIDANAFIDMLTDAIPGEIDDMVGAALKGAIA